MKIRKATASDIDRVEEIYNCILDLEENGVVTIGWDRKIYPQRKHALEALENEELFVLEDHQEVVGSARINQIQVPEYYQANWRYEAQDSQVMVLHTLTIDPNKGQKGYGKFFVAFYENYAKEHHCPFLRMDTNAINQRARNMYAKLGYWEADIVDCVFNGIQGVKLVCLEKKLDI